MKKYKQLIASYLLILISILGSRLEASESSLIRLSKHDVNCALGNGGTEGQCSTRTRPNCGFRAAVYEHLRIDRFRDDGDDWRKTIEANLLVYKYVAKVASKNNANVLVFPEDGIIIGRREFIDPSLPELPNPKELTKDNNNPCLHDHYFKDELFTIIRELSCIARDNSLYVIANFGTKLTCKLGEKYGNQDCPRKGYFALNTDVVLGPDGVFLEQYRKFNLFKPQEVFDKPPSLETTYFDTPYGRFGLITCFDMMFKSPAVDLIEKFHVDTIIFPTWWYDELPSLSAIQFQDGWSARHRVNLLASNIYNRDIGSVGSGIYSAGNDTVYVGANSEKPKLILATIPARRSPDARANCKTEDFNPVILDVATSEKIENYVHKNFTVLPSDILYALEHGKETKTFCLNKFCCTLDIQVNNLRYTNKLLDEKRVILLMRNGLRPGYFNWYEQICSIVTLTRPLDSRSLETTQYSTYGLLNFEKVTLTGTFQTKYVYPIAAYEVSELIGRSRREFKCDAEDDNNSCKLSYTNFNNDVDKPIYSFGLYGRLYESDEMPIGW